MAYGTDKHEDYSAEHGAAGHAESPALRDEVASLRADLDKLATRGDAPREIAAIRDRLAALEPRLGMHSGEAR